MDDVQGTLLDGDVLRRLIKHLEATDVDEVEFVHGETRLFLRREPGRRGAPLTGAPPVEETSARGIAVVAPLTGVLYTRPSPELEPFVTVGALVEAGQVVALIETMKLFNEVTIDFAGEVTSIDAKEGMLIEVGQPLLYVAPRGESEEP